MTPTSSQQLISLSKREKNANKRIRLLAVAYFLESQNRTQVARRLNVSRSSVNKWYLTTYQLEYLVLMIKNDTEENAQLQRSKNTNYQHILKSKVVQLKGED